jgi:hypothetical protein
MADAQERQHDSLTSDCTGLDPIAALEAAVEHGRDREHEGEHHGYPNFHLNSGMCRKFIP